MTTTRDSDFWNEIDNFDHNRKNPIGAGERSARVRDLPAPAIKGSIPRGSTIRTLILIQSERPIFMLRGGAVWLVRAGFWILLACLYASAKGAEVMHLRLVLAHGRVPVWRR